MSDIVERLRAPSSLMTKWTHVALHGDAADEIERLRSDSIERERWLEQRNAEIKQLRERIQEFWEALDLLTTTLAPKSEIDAVNPRAIAKTIEATVRARVAELEARLCGEISWHQGKVKNLIREVWRRDDAINRLRARVADAWDEGYTAAQQDHEAGGRQSRNPHKEATP